MMTTSPLFLITPFLFQSHKTKLPTIIMYAIQKSTTAKGRTVFDSSEVLFDSAVFSRHEPSGPSESATLAGLRNKSIDENVLRFSFSYYASYTGRGATLGKLIDFLVIGGWRTPRCPQAGLGPVTVRLPHPNLIFGLWVESHSVLCFAVYSCFPLPNSMCMDNNLKTKFLPDCRFNHGFSPFSGKKEMESVFHFFP
jgi:hypothetical protein